MVRFNHTKLTLFIGLLGSILSLEAKPKATRAHDWQDVEEKAENAVVQIVSQHSYFNWQEPFRAPKQQEGTGTGFFINKQGHLLTNFHVVDQAKSIKLYIPALGQKPVDAEVVGVCPEADVAYLKLPVEALEVVKKSLEELPVLPLGDSDTLFPTEPVLAIGYPHGLRYQKRTVGVLAGREYIDGKSYMHITAPINPGNSGGPLLNLDGKVAGITSAGILTAQNIGYIIPIYDVKILLKDLTQQRLVPKAQPGIRTNPTTEEHARFLGNPLPAGAYVNTVELGSIAEKAGVKEGDMIYGVNDYVVDSYGDVTVNWPSASKVSLDEFFVRVPLKSKLKLRVMRNGVEKILTCDYCSPKAMPIRFVYPEHEADAVDYEIIGGMCVMQMRLNHLNIFPNVLPLQQYRLFENQHQELLIITKLLAGSTVQKVNCFYEGAILDEVNGKVVNNLAQLRDALKESAKSGFISIKTKDKVATVVSAKAVLADEQDLANDFKYVSTPGMKALKDLMVSTKAK